MRETVDLQDFQNQVALLSKRFAQIEHAARIAEADSLGQRVRQAAAKLGRKTFQLAVVGAFSTGKSTLINALVRKIVLPVKARECTVVLTRVCAAEPGVPTHAELTLANNVRVEVPVDVLDSVLTTANSEYEGQEVIEATVSLAGVSWLERGVEIVDTPGINAAGLRSERTTLEFMPKADAIVFLTRADRLLTQDELDFLRERVMAEERARLFVVVNAADRIESEADRVGLSRRCTERLADVLPGARVHMVSAVNACYALEDDDEGAWRSSGVPTLLGELERFLASERAAAQLERFQRAYEALRADLRAIVHQRLEALDLDEDLRRQRMQRVEELIDYAKQDERSLVKESNQAFDALRHAQMQHVARASQELQSRLARLNEGADDVVQATAEQAVARKGRSLLAELQKTFRGEVPRIHARLAERLNALFDKIDGTFSAKTAIAVADLDFESLVSIRSIEVTETEQRPLAERPSSDVGEKDAWIGAGIGALIGGLLLGPIGALAVGAIGYGATDRVKEQTFFETITRTVSRRQVDGRAVVARFRDALLPGVDEAMAEIRDRTATDITLMVRSKVDELHERLADLKRGRDSDVETRTEALKQVLAELAQPALPNPAGA